MLRVVRGPTRLRPWKLLVALRLWVWLLEVRLSLQRQPLPDVVRRLERAPRFPVRPLDPLRLSKISYRTLRVGQQRPTCLLRSLVHFRYLRAQGDLAELVIGLPEEPTRKEAHAWIEIDGVDVGPPPGRAGHIAWVRYPDRNCESFT